MSTTNPEIAQSNISPSTIWRRRFRDVAKSLRAIKLGDDSPGQLHELRIACRRMEAVLRLVRDGIDSRPWRWLRKNVRDLRRSTNELRDDDVLRKWLAENEPASPGLRRKLKRERAERMDEVVQKVRWILRRNRFERRARRVHAQMKSLGNPPQAAPIFGRGLARELTRFVETLPGNRLDAHELHQTRIACKRLRYAIEGVAEMQAATDLGELTELLKSLQKHLGGIHDQVVREDRLRELAVPGGRSCAVAKPDPGEQKRLDVFLAWWQAQPLERILADAMAEVVSLMRTGLRDAP